MTEQIRIKDKRQGVFTVDNVVLNSFGKIMGATGIAFYITLCRYANNTTQQTYPSLTTIAKETGMDRKTIINCAKLCVELNLIKKEVKAGKYTLYTLLEPKPHIENTDWWKFHTGGKNTPTSGKSTHIRTKNTNLEYNPLSIVSPLKKYSSLKDITETDLMEISERYKIPPAFVKLCLEKMTNWLEAKRKTYKNYKRALMNWVLSDAQKRVERSASDKYRAVDARNIK